MKKQIIELRKQNKTNNGVCFDTDTNSEGLERHKGFITKGGEPGRERKRQDGQATNMGIRGREENTWNLLGEFTPGVCRVGNGIPSRMDRLKGLGNAIVPQVAQVIMQAIKDINETD